MIGRLHEKLPWQRGQRRKLPETSGEEEGDGDHRMRKETVMRKKTRRNDT